MSSHFRAGADTGVAGRWQAGGGRHEPSRRRTETSGGGRGYPAIHRSNWEVGAGSSAGSGVGSRSALTASHSGGPRGCAIKIAAVGSARAVTEVRTGEWGASTPK